MEETLARTADGNDEQTVPARPTARPPARQVIHSGYMAR
jgi:hypothetical protein